MERRSVAREGALDKRLEVLMLPLAEGAPSGAPHSSGDPQPHRPGLPQQLSPVHAGQALEEDHNGLPVARRHAPVDLM